jgi:dipeptidyl aminopeptidase/acylaminoacyl peptidase
MSSSPDLAEWPYHIFGINYTSAIVPTDILTAAWDKSALSYVDKLSAATLIFLGSEDKRVLPESQGIALYKALRSRMTTPTSLYHYPGK